MTPKQKIDRYLCDRCAKIEEMESSFLFSHLPNGWGYDLQKTKMLCSHCKADYDHEYRSWFSDFMRRKRK